jgi:hypothetical protein
MGYAQPSAAPAADSRPADKATQDRRWIEILVGLVLVAMVFAQKLGPPAAGSHVELILILTYAVLAVLVMRQAVMISAMRLCLLALLFAAMAISQWTSQAHWALTAAMIVLALYCPFIFVLPVKRNTYLRILNAFQLAMLVVVAIVAAQQIAQFTIGAKYWPDLNKLIPEALLVPGYNYLRETSYGSGIFMPNGIFFLEPSIVSQFFALAIIIEVALFRRLRLIAYAAGLLMTMAGSGLFVLALALPFALFRLGKRFVPYALAALVVILPVSQAIGWTDKIAARTSEFTQPGSSGYIRYTQPINEMVERLTTREGQFYSGIGAGNTLSDPGHNSLGVTKLVNEYGLLTAIAFYGFIFACIFGGGAPSLALAWGVFVYYSIGGGGLSVGIYALPLLFFASLMRVEDDPEEEQAQDVEADEAEQRPYPALP